MPSLKPFHDAKIPDSWLIPAAHHRSVGSGRQGSLSCGIVHKRGTGWDFVLHQPDHYSVVWCLRGHGRYHDDHGRTWEIHPGDLFFRFTDRQHGNELDPHGQWVEAYIGFGAPLGQALVDMGAISAAAPVLTVGIDLVLLRTLIEYRDALRDAPERDLALHLGRFVHLHQDIIARAGQRAVKEPYEASLDQACQRLAREPHISLHYLARECGLSYERFRKIFRERLGVSPHEYRIRRRIDQARTALHTEETSIQDIATRLGYANPFQFSAQFKRLVGMSPAAYRRR